MKSRALLATAALTLALAACNDEPTGPQCEPLELRQGATVGDTLSLTTGLRYIEGRVGTGAAVQYCRAVRLHYTGFLPNGTKFDSSRDRGQPFDFATGFGQVIPGFEQGVIGMKVGGTRRLIIPPNLGYGSQPQGPIPANSTLIFDIEVVAVQQ
ncbi:MAG: FKBP-type peptidyl-prolyl cis-trans isomerase [Gemmatimonadota bacterium]|nr:FKBP-type peptidyl-prolyl cis-trans isomerase [Gemmatimonadota bacterium]